MLDLTTTARDIEYDAGRAMHGDADALNKLRKELHNLHSDQLKALAPKLVAALGSSSNALFGGVRVDHDTNGDVSSFTFVPPLEDRPNGSHSVQADVALSNFIDDAGRLFDKLDTNRDGTLSLAELASASANPRFKGRDASVIAGLSALEEGVEHPRFPDGFNKYDLEQLRYEWSDTNGVAHAALDAQKAITNNKTLFGQNGITPDAINQGLMGDCVLESSMASLAATHPEKIKDMIKDNKNGTYTVTFGPGHAFTVTAPTETEQAVANRGKQNGIWPLIIEKAFSKYWQELNPSNADNHIMAIGDGLEPPEALSRLTNRPTENLDNENLHVPGAKVAEFLQRHLSKHDPIIAGAREYLDGNTADGYDAGHEYSVMAFDPKGPNGGTVTIRNPWGGKTNTSDGEWKISLWAFRANFADITAANMDGHPLPPH